MIRIRSRSGAAYEEHLAELAEYLIDHDLTEEDHERMKRQDEEDAAEVIYF